MSVTDQQIVAYIEQIFAQYDWDHSGNLDATELTVFFNDLNRMMGINRVVSLPEAQQALQLIDTDHDGKASKAELFQSFRSDLIKQGLYVGGQQYANSGYNYNQLSNMNINQPVNQYPQQQFYPPPNQQYYPPQQQVQYQPPPPNVIVVNPKQGTVQYGSNPPNMPYNPNYQ